MARFAWLVLGLALACSRETAAPAAPPEVTADPSASASTVEDWILSRLRAPKRALVPLGQDAPEIDTRGAIASAAYRVEAPALWLLVYRFDDYAEADAAQGPIVKALEAGAPHSIRTSITGAYLLVIGFASDEPVSAKMEAVQTEYLSAFAGEE